ncbi:aminopeptidase [Desulfohalovibrio reitneri]|uniref:aminopeptidase n=1 Tax=Desulfohalovibrio reitneri TaxID=1307759 RepID=UPI0004A70F6C|nr:aminopeptidase [Desulfohalovibrio reitneri]
MFTPDQLEKYADVLLWALRTSRGKALTSSESVLVNFDRQAHGLAEVLHTKLLQAGLNPFLRILPTPRMERALYSEGRFNQIRFIPPGEEEMLRGIGGAIHLLAPESLTHLADVDPDDLSLRQLSRKPLRDLLDRREQAGAFGWTLGIHPTEALAAQAGMPVEEYAAEVAAACLLNLGQPEKDWALIHKQTAEIRAWLDGMGISTLRVESERCDLEMGVGDNRRWLGLTGHNVPSFEIYTSPDCRTTRGVYFADQPSFRQGNIVQGVRLEFKRGNLVGLSAERGEAFAIRQTSMDPGAKRLGEFSLTDARFSRIKRFMAHTLFDENFGGEQGNCHIALGMAYPDTFDGEPAILNSDLKKALGFNSSALHWDLVNTEAKIVTAHLAGGGSKVIYENGCFTL